MAIGRSPWVLVFVVLIILVVQPVSAAETYNYVTKWGSAGAADGQFITPGGIALDSGGKVYVADAGNNRIQKFDSNGIHLLSFGTVGGNASEFVSPQGVVADSAGNIYVLDTGNSRIQKFNSLGNYLAEWGMAGTGDMNMSSPQALAMNNAGNIFVADTGNNRIIVFTQSGILASKWALSYAPYGVAAESTNVYVLDRTGNKVQKFNNGGTFLGEWGTGGTGDGQFSSPSAIATDTAHYVYVTDSGNQRVQKFTSNGGFFTKWGASGAGNGDFTNPAGVVVNSATSDVFVVDSGNSRVEKFTRGYPPCPTLKSVSPNFGTTGTTQFVYKIVGTGFNTSANVRLQMTGHADIVATNVTVTSDSLMSCSFPLSSYLATGAWDVVITNPDGQFVVLPGGFAVNAPSTPPPEEYVYAGEWGTQGAGDGQFNSPGGISADSAGNTYVADTLNNRVQKFDPSGNFLMKWGRNGGDGSAGTGDGEFDHPVGITLDPSGNVYVTDRDNHRVQKFSATGAFLAKWGSYGAGDTQFNAPIGIRADDSGNVWVVDSGNNQLKEFDADGIFLTRWDLRLPEGYRNYVFPVDVIFEGSDVYISYTDTYYGPASLLRKYNNGGGFLKEWNIGSGTGSSLVNSMNGDFFAVKPHDNTIVRYSSSLTEIAKWGTAGAGDAQFSSAQWITTDPDGIIYVSDSNNNRIQKFVRPRLQEPRIQYLNPNYGTQGTEVFVSKIQGTGFVNGATARLRTAGHADIVATNVTFLSSENISCTFPINSLTTTGPWDVLLTNPDGQTSTLVSGFTVNAPALPLTEEYVYAGEWGRQGSRNGQFNSPGGIATDLSGNVFVADRYNHRIQKFDPSGNFLMKWGRNGGDGSAGTGDGEFNGPWGLATDTVGNVYVVDTGNSRVQKFNGNGTFLTKWGTYGSASRSYDQFDAPIGICTDAADNLYVADTSGYGDYLKKFNSDGTFLTMFNIDRPYMDAAGVMVDQSNIYVSFVDNGNQGGGNHITKYNEAGVMLNNWPLEYRSMPYGIVSAQSGDFFLAVSNSNILRKYSDKGQLIAQWGTAGSGESQFVQPQWIAMDKDGMLYVSEYGNNRIQKFVRAEPPGPRVYSVTPNFGSQGSVVPVANISGRDFIAGATISLQMTGQDPIPVTNVTVISPENMSCTFTLSGLTVTGAWDVLITNPDGQNVTLTQGFTVNEPSEPFSEEYVYAGEWGRQGSGSGQFNSPGGIATDLSGNVFVADRYNHRIQKFDPSGNFLMKWGRNGGDGSPGTGDGEFNSPWALTTDTAGNVYVVDNGNSRVQKFNGNGTFLTKWGAAGSSYDQFSNPQGIRIDGSGDVWVVDADNYQLKKFNADGTFLTLWDLRLPDWYRNYVLPFDVIFEESDVYISYNDRGNNNWLLRKYDGSGSFLTEWDMGSRSSPSGLASGELGDFFVVKKDYNTIVKYSSSVTTIASWGTAGSGHSQFSSPYWIATDSDGTVYVSDYGNNRIQKFRMVLPPEALPIVDFTANSTTGAAPFTVQFSDRSLREPRNWSWDFGDGNTSVFQNPSFTYTIPGTYNVTLTAGNINGLNATTKPAYIVVRDHPVTPVADFTAAPTSGLAPLHVQFTDTSLNEPDHWNWSFGDGQYSEEKDPAHEYTTPGEYSVRLRVINSQGTDSISKTDLITVNGTPIQPVANFTASPASGNASLIVQFTDHSTGYPDTWSWTFGDIGPGNTSPERNPVHEYTTPGIYTVNLSVSNSAGTDKKTRIGYINVSGQLGPNTAIMYLSPGWNFVSTPRRLSEGNKTAMIFASVDTAGHSIFRYNGNLRAWERVGSTDTVFPLEGYWIYSTKNDLVQLWFDENRLITPPTKLCYQGWNAIGFSDTQPTSAKYALISVKNIWAQVIGFDAQNQMYEVSIINGATGSHDDTRDMFPMKGYWLYATGDGELAAIGA